MYKILIGGAGGAPSEGVIKSLQKDNSDELIIGMGSDSVDLAMSAASKKYMVPIATDDEYRNVLLSLLEKEKPALIHFQNDLEIFHASKLRDDISEKGVKIFMPRHEVIDRCVHKYDSYLAFKENHITVPENIMINNKEDLQKAFNDLGNIDGKIWLRSSLIGGGGKGSLATTDIDLAKAWIDHHSGWGCFIAAEMLTGKTVTWLSIWHEGELIVAQTRARSGWVHGNRSVSGVTGVTKVGRTVSSDIVTEVAMASIKAVDDKPHGIFGVDMAYDKKGIPNPTEINISRFFTTILFFTEAGLNMPKIFKDIALYNRFPQLQKKINPLKNDLCWLRGMDREPGLFNENNLQREFESI